MAAVRNIPPSEPASAQPFDIHLIKPESTASVSSARPPDKLTPPKEKQAEPERHPPPSVEQAADSPPPIVEILMPAQPYYFPTTELTEKPQVQFDISPDLAFKLSSKTPHSAILRLQINEQGEIDQIVIDESDFPESEQQLLIDAMRKMKFAPGKIIEKSVKSELRIELITERIVPIPYPK
jgi:hypothetical protein